MKIRQIASLITEQGVILEDSDFKYKIYTTGQNDIGEIGRARKELERMQHKLDQARLEGQNFGNETWFVDRVAELEQFIDDAAQQEGYGPNEILADDVVDAGKPWIFAGIGPEVTSGSRTSIRNKLPKNWYYYRNDEYNEWLPEARRILTKVATELDQSSIEDEGEILSDVDVFDHGSGYDYHVRRFAEMFDLPLSAEMTLEKISENQYVQQIMSQRPANPQQYKKHERILTIKKTNISKIEKIQVTQ